MDQAVKGLTKNEWILMEVLWDSGEPLVISEIQERLPEDVAWSYSTLQTRLGRMVKKGYLTYVQRGRIRFFEPLVSREECIADEALSIEDRMTMQASNALLVHLMRNAKDVSTEEIAELEELIENLRKEAEEQGD